MKKIGGPVLGGIVLLLVGLWALNAVENWFVRRGALHDAELDRLTKRDAVLVREIANDRATLKRQSVAAAASRDSSRTALARSERLRRGMHLAVDTLERVDTLVVGQVDTFTVPQRVKDRIDADSVTIARLSRTVIRDSVALATAQRIIVLSADSLAQVRADIAKNLKSRIPSKWGTRVKLIAAFGAGVYLGAQARRL